MYIKNSCKAVILDGEKILAIKGERGGELHYTLPGGGQLGGETMESAVIREVREETGFNIAVKGMCMAGERFSGGIQKSYHIFRCEILGDGGEGSKPDPNQTGIEWLSLSDTDKLYPRFIAKRLPELLSAPFIWLGCEDDGEPVIDRGSITVKYLQDYIRSKDCRQGCEETYFVKIIEEAGELARLVIRGAPKAEGKSFKGTYEEELWDVMYYVVALANLYDVDLEKWIPIKEEYNNERYHHGLRFDPEEWCLLDKAHTL